METSGEIVAQTSGPKKQRKRRKPKRIGRPRKKISRKVTESVVEASKNSSISDTNEANKTTASSADEESAPPTPEPTKKINDLISEEEKRTIESYYYLDLSFVDEKKVKKTIISGGAGLFRCKLCQAGYSRLDKCQVHVWRHYDMLPYVCRACDFRALTVTGARGHVRQFHLRLKPFGCPECGRRFAAAALLREHGAAAHSADRQHYRCDACDFACSGKHVLVAHMAKHKSIKDVLCDICGKAFFSTKQMRAHRNGHEESNAIKCELCLAYVSSETALRRHYANVHTRDYECEFCEKKYATRKAFHNHVYQVHSKGRHQCALCPNVYKSSSMLQDHILKHQGIRKYKCEICGKSFAQRTHVTTHMAVHDDKRYECPGCHKGFNRQDNMKVHTKNCAKFLADPELAKLLPTRKTRTIKNPKILDSTESVHVTIKVEPTLDPDVTIKVEPSDEVD